MGPRAVKCVSDERCLNNTCTMQRYRSGASFSKFSFITAIRGAFIITSRARFDVIIFIWMDE
jgi:hypothetical protein